MARITRVCQAIAFLYACMSVASATEVLRNHGCSPVADVLFIVDASESITRMDFNKTKNYVKREIQSLNVFPDGANIAVIVYSDDVSDVINFNDNRNVVELESAITAIKQPRLGTNTASALREARKMFREQGRAGATKIVVLITDGDVRDTAPPRDEARYLKADQVSVIAIGVGKDAVQAELEAMASEPQYVKKVDTFAGLDMLKLPYSEVCPTGTTPLLGTFQPDEECEINGNVIFIFDGSESISVGEEMIMKDFVNEQIDLLKLGSGKAGMGLVLFSNDATAEIRLSNTISAERLKQEVNNLRLPSRGSNIARGIEVMTQMFNTFGNPDKNRIAVLITDGVSIDKDETAAIARRARQDGIEMVAIGVGSEEQIDYDELTKIASSPNLVFTPTTFDDFISTEFASKLSVGRECSQPTTVQTTRATTLPRTTRSRTTAVRTTRVRTTASWTTRPRTPTSWTTRQRTTASRTTRSRTTASWTTRQRTTPTTRPRITTRRTTTQRRTSVASQTTPTIIGAEECKNCRILYGSGFARHPESCEKFLRCTIEPLGNGQFRAISSVVFDCPRGLFWDQEDSLTCRYPNEVNCPLDRCRTEPGLKAYGDPLDCQVYWVCSGGVSMYKQCCDAGYAFDDSRSECVANNNCASPFCQPGPPGGVCPFTANATDETWFFTSLNGISIGRRCGAGLAFVQETCGCHKRIALPTEKPVDGCQPDVYLPFDEDILDHSGHNRGIGNSGAVVEAVSGAQGGGAGKFDGTDSVWIYRYNNMDFPPYVEIRFRFQELPQSSGRSTPEALVTNGNCGDNPSIAISSQRSSSDVTFFTETRSGSSSPKVSSRNGWTDVKYVYDRTQLTGTLGSSTQSEDLTGVIRRTRSPLIIGHGEGFQNFTGYIDEFYVYFCKP